MRTALGILSFVACFFVSACAKDEAPTSKAVAKKREKEWSPKYSRSYDFEKDAGEYSQPSSRKAKPVAPPERAPIPSEPAEPTEPTEPMEPTESTEPAERADGVDEEVAPPAASAALETVGGAVGGVDDDDLFDVGIDAQEPRATATPRVGAIAPAPASAAPGAAPAPTAVAPAAVAPVATPAAAAANQMAQATLDDFADQFSGTYKSECQRNTGHGFQTRLDIKPTSDTAGSFEMTREIVFATCLGGAQGSLKLVYEYKVSGASALHPGGVDLSVKLATASMVVTNDRLMQLFNGTQNCGISNWALNVPQDIAGKRCGGDEYSKREVHSIALIESGNQALHFGIPSGADTGFTKDRRHTTFGGFVYLPF